MTELIKIITNDEGKQLVSARELHEGLEIKTRFNDWVNRMIEYWFEENIDYTVITRRKVTTQGNETTFTDYIITLDIAKDICRKQRRNPVAIDILNYFLSIDDKEVCIIDRQRKELEFIEILKQTLEPYGILDFEEQYFVSNKNGGYYRIDLYIPSLKIAIEFDESQHKYYSYEAQEGRQKEIEDKLGCTFIRVNDGNSIHYNVGYCIREILKIKTPYKYVCNL